MGSIPLPQQRPQHAILLPPTGRDKPGSKGAEDKRQRALKEKADSKASSTSTVSVGADADVESLVGAMADILRVTETAEVPSIAGSEWSIPKFRDFFGQERCWAHVATSKHGVEALKTCNHAGKPGHEAGGELHSCTDQQRTHIHMHSNDFKPEGYCPQKKRHPSSGNGKP